MGGIFLPEHMQSSVNKQKKKKRRRNHDLKKKKKKLCSSQTVVPSKLSTYILILTACTGFNISSGKNYSKFYSVCEAIYKKEHLCIKDRNNYIFKLFHHIKNKNTTYSWSLLYRNST